MCVCVCVCVYVCVCVCVCVCGCVCTCVCLYPHSYMPRIACTSHAHHMHNQICLSLPLVCRLAVSSATSCGCYLSASSAGKSAVTPVPEISRDTSGTSNSRETFLLGSEYNYTYTYLTSFSPNLHEVFCCMHLVAIKGSI